MKYGTGIHELQIEATSPFLLPVTTVLQILPLNNVYVNILSHLSSNYPRKTILT